MSLSIVDELEVIFSDCDVVDVDFSEWDKFISIVVVSDHMEHKNGRRPVFIVKFIEVVSINFRYVKEVPILDGNKHCTWSISGSELLVDGDVMHFSLSSSSPGSNIEVKCRQVELESIENKTLDVFFPGWNKPYSPLIRRHSWGHNI